jgi:TRAP-type C4-dicarboxylate transport system permease large subunit
MLLAFSLGVFWLHLPSGVALAFASVVGTLSAGLGIPIRQLIEGTFGYLDAVLIIATATIFMKSVEATGALSTISYVLVRSFHGTPTVLMIFITFFVMLPGMLTGLSSACILTTGALVAPALIAMGIPSIAVGSFIAMAAVYGMIAPPINIPVMIIGGGVDMPYIGFDGPLMLLTFPLAVLLAVYFRVRYVRTVRRNEVLSKLQPPVYAKHGPKLFLPFLVVVGLMIGIRVFPEWISDLGIPFIFVVGTISAIGTGERLKFARITKDALNDALPIMGILVGVGMFVQIMTLTGVRGWLAITALELPSSFLYPGIAAIMPAFGSAYAASSVLGVPLIFVFLGKNEILVACGLSLIAGIGDLMPPPSLLTVLSAQLLGIKNHFLILKESIFPIAVSLIAGVLMIMFSSQIGKLF